MTPLCDNWQHSGVLQNTNLGAITLMIGEKPQPNAACTSLACLGQGQQRGAMKATWVTSWGRESIYLWAPDSPAHGWVSCWVPGSPAGPFSSGIILGFLVPFQPFWLPAPGSASQRDCLDQWLYSVLLKYRAVQKHMPGGRPGGIFHCTFFSFIPLFQGGKQDSLMDSFDSQHQL